MPWIPNTQIAAAGGSGGVVYTLTAGTSVGATSVSITPTPTPYTGEGMYVGINAGTSSCELAYVTGVSGVTLTVFPSLERIHSVGEKLVFFPDSIIHPNYFGCAGDNSTDDWVGLQRLFYQASRMPVSVGNYGPIIDGTGTSYRVSQPLTFGQHTLHNIKIVPTAGFSPIDANNAVMMLGKVHIPFTATASDNTFLSLGSAFANLNEPIVFNAMYGETLPTGISGGRVYYVKTRVDSTHITVSATVGGAEIDLTTDGGGWFCNQVGLLSKCWWEDVVIEPGLADLNGIIMGMQQPGEIKRLRVNMTVACTRTTYGLLFGDVQIARVYNPEFVVTGGENVVGIAIGTNTVPSTGAVGVHVSDANFAGSTNTGQTHIVIGGSATCDGTVIDGETWLEGPGDAGIRIDGGRGTYIGPLYCSGAPTNGMVYETVNTASWEIEQMIWSSTDKVLITTDEGVLFKTDGSSVGPEADGGKTFGGMRRPYQQGPILKDRFYRATSADITARYIDDLIDVNATGAARTITLRSAVGMSGHKLTVKKNDATANTVTIDAAGSETIDGATTKVLTTQWEFVTIQSDGASWKIVG